MTAVEHSAVAYGRTRIGYAIRRSVRRGTVSIAIDPEQGVLVTAPRAVSLARLDQVVRRKGLWIVERLRNRAVLERPTPKEFVSGETFRYLGRGYRLKIVAGAAEGAVMRGGWLRTTVDQRHGNASRSDRVRRLLAVWYRQHAHERLPGVVEEWAARLHVRPAAVLIREAPKRWGSCDPTGNLRLNWRMVQAAPRLIEYVVAHELVHLHHEHHTAAFWATLGRVMPDYDARRTDLRRVGATFLW